MVTAVHVMFRVIQLPASAYAFACAYAVIQLHASAYACAYAFACDMCCYSIAYFCYASAKCSYEM